MVRREKRMMSAQVSRKTREGKREGTDVLMKEGALTQEIEEAAIGIIRKEEAAAPGVIEMTEEVEGTDTRDLIIETEIAMRTVTAMIVMTAHVIVMTGEMIDLAAAMIGGMIAIAIGTEDLMVTKRAIVRESPGQDVEKVEGTDHSRGTVTGTMIQEGSTVERETAVLVVRRDTLHRAKTEDLLAIILAVAVMLQSHMAMIHS